MLKHRRRVNEGVGELASEFAVDPYPVYGERDLERFGEEIERFRKDGFFITKEGQKQTYSCMDVQEAAVAYGALKKTEHLGVSTYAVRLRVTDERDGRASYDYPSLYDRFIDKLNQYTSMVNRKNFIEAKKVEGLEELAATMDVGHTPAEVELETA